MYKPLSIALAIAAAYPASSFAQEDNRVVITGSNLRVTQKEGAAAVQVITAKELRDSGKTSVADVLRAISANSGNSYNEQYTGSFSAGTAGLSLRGIGQKNTLILVNGKRVSSYATAQDTQEVFVDLNSLPMAAVQRIEILKDGASSVYGSDAVAGVANIILNKEFSGTEITAQAGTSATGTGQAEQSVLFQTGWGQLQKDGYAVSWSLDAQKRDKLQQSDVSWLRDSDFRHQQNGSLAWVATNYFGTNPTNSFGGVQGPLQIVPYSAITPGKTGNVLAYNPAPYRTLIPGIERVHSALSGSLRINQDIEVYAEWLYSYSRADETFSAPLSVSSSLRAWNNPTQSLVSIPVILPVGNPSNPGSTPLPFTATLFDLGPRMKTDRVTFYRALAGVKGYSSGWDWDVSAAQSSSVMVESVANFVNRYAFQQVLADGSYNFANQALNSENVRNSLRLSTRRPAESDLSVLDFSASKDLLTLPAGHLSFAGGAQWRREAMNSQTSTAVLSGTELRPAINIIDGQRDVSALFGEFNVPVIQNLNLNLAGRYDHYSDFGHAFSPKASLRYQAADWLLLRATASRGFRAPSFPEITQSTTVSYGSVLDPRDPVSPNQPRGVTYITTANPGLQPEHSDNLNFGIVIAPSANTSLGIDYYHITQKGVIGTESADTIIANERTAPWKILRDEQGRITTLYLQYRNQGNREVSGLDIDVRHRLNTPGWGNITLNGQLSYVLRFAQPLADGEPLTEGAGTNYFGSIPKLRGVTSANWEYGDLSTTLIWNYTGGYQQESASNEYVKPYTTFDLTVSRKLTPATTVSLIVQNLTDRKPSWDSSTNFFDMTQADPRGRFVSVKFNHRF
jgi:iron complex outermembrane receptor protein